MGEVWKATGHTPGPHRGDQEGQGAAQRTIQAGGESNCGLNHPYICQLHDIGPDYLVLEYVEGKPLSSPLPEREAVRLAIQIATALEAAHKKGIIHRDLKPGNIMVTDEGSVKLLDFGLAKLYEQDASNLRFANSGFPGNAGGSCSRNPGLHVARAGARPTGGCAVGYFLLRAGVV